MSVRATETQRIIMTLQEERSTQDLPADISQVESPDHGHQKAQISTHQEEDSQIQSTARKQQKQHPPLQPWYVI